jgi:hypothetical protein
VAVIDRYAGFNVNTVLSASAPIHFRQDFFLTKGEATGKASLLFSIIKSLYSRNKTCSENSIALLNYNDFNG